MRYPAWLIFVSISGCSGEKVADEPTTERIVIAPLVALSALSEEADRLAAHRPASVDCNNLTGWYVEDGRLEANTAECNYLALVEPAARDAHAGEVLKTQLSHFDLTAAEAAEAHIALLVESDIIWEHTVPIPADAHILEISIPLERDIREGDLIGIHLHNHGQNSWNLSPLFLEREI